MSRVQNFMADIGAAAAALTHKPPTGRIARRAHLLSMALSQEDFTEQEAGDSILTGDGEVDTTVLLAALLRALGLDLPPTTDEQDFKRALAEAAIKKTTELAQRGVGKISGTNAKVAPTNPTNPLIPGGSTELPDATYMALSLENEAKLRAQATNAAWAAALQQPQLPEAEADRVAERLFGAIASRASKGGTSGGRNRSVGSEK